MEIIDNISADTIEVGDLLIIEGVQVEVRAIVPSDDPDEVCIRAWSYESGDVETFELYADDYFEVWTA